VTPDELARQEDAHREIIEALGKLSHQAQASPDFLGRVMEQADRLPLPRWHILAWLRPEPGWTPTTVTRVAFAVVLVLAMIGAVPQYLAWINAYTLGVPSESIHWAKAQERLWKKNFACATQLANSSSNYAALTGEQVVVVAWACPSGDVLVTLESPVDESFRRSVWISLKTPWQFTRRFPLLVQEALAAAGSQRADIGVAPMVEVLCQRWLPNRFIKRRIQLADGRCFDEVINPRTGQVVSRQNAPCDRAC
jgi:hypothetical protein